MTPEDRRTVISEVLLITAALITMWMYVVKPIKSSLQEEQAEFALVETEVAAREARTQLRGMTGQELLIRSKRDAAAIDRAASRDHDASGAYEAMRELASEHNVRIDRVEPGRSANQGRSLGKGIPDLVGEKTRIHLIGRFDDVSRFSQAAQDAVGINKVGSIKIVPGPASTDPETVEATVEVEGYWFTGHLANVEGKGS